MNVITRIEEAMDFDVIPYWWAPRGHFYSQSVMGKLCLSFRSNSRLSLGVLPQGQLPQGQLPHGQLLLTPTRSTPTRSTPTNSHKVNSHKVNSY